MKGIEIKQKGSVFKLYSLIKEGSLKCISIETPKTINFPFVPNGKLTVFKCPKI